MKKLLLIPFLLLAYSAISQVSNCDLELLNINWDLKEITLTLNDNNCSNSSTPFWVPTEDSVYVMQLGFSFGGTTCLIPATAFTMFHPPLGLNDTITYYFGDWFDTFNCFNSAFNYYQENCIVTVSAVGVNNSINLDLVGSNNYIGFNPVWGNCYNTLDINAYIRDITYYIYNHRGEFLYATEEIEWGTLKGLFFVKQGGNVRKFFVN